MKNLISTILLLIYCTYSNAQEVADLYQAEIIVFKQIEADASIDKLKNLIPSKKNQPAERAALDLFQADAYDKIYAVPNNQLKLLAEARKIKQDSRYELLYHGAWRQPPHHRAEAPYINILNEPQNGLLKGIAWMSYERYFKLLLDFQYDPHFNERPQVVDTPQTFSIPIHLERVMAEKKLFYIDHPIIGVIAIINPV